MLLKIHYKIWILIVINIRNYSSFFAFAFCLNPIFKISYPISIITLFYYFYHLYSVPNSNIMLAYILLIFISYWIYHVFSHKAKSLELSGVKWGGIGCIGNLFVFIFSMNLINGIYKIITGEDEVQENYLLFIFFFIVILLCIIVSKFILRKIENDINHEEINSEILDDPNDFV
jgi:hypothetical protein